jgi:hypothetical protein
MLNNLFPARSYCTIPAHSSGVSTSSWTGLEVEVSVGIANRCELGGLGIESRTRPDLPWGPSSLLYSRYRVSFPGVNWPGRGVDHPLSSSAEVKERIELYFYSTSDKSIILKQCFMVICFRSAHQ